MFFNKKKLGIITQRSISLPKEDAMSEKPTEKTATEQMRKFNENPENTGGITCREKKNLETSGKK